MNEETFWGAVLVVLVGILVLLMFLVVTASGSGTYCSASGYCEYRSDVHIAGSKGCAMTQYDEKGDLRLKVETCKEGN